MNMGTDQNGRESAFARPRLDLLQALNAAAATLQGSSHSEVEVLRAFKEQITRLHLRGTLSFLDDSGQTLTFCAVGLPGHSLAALEAVAGITAEGLMLPLAAADHFRQVIQTGQSVYLADTSDIIMGLVPVLARPITRQVLSIIGSWPGIYAPLMGQTGVIGLLTVAGPGLVEQDMAAVTAFANHIAVAVQNARLFQAVSQAESQYRRLFETALEGIMILDPATNHIVSANARAAALTGYSEQELCTLTVSQLYRPEREAAVRQLLAALYQNGRHIFELPLCHKEGHEWIAQISAVHYQVNGRPMVQGVLRDVTAERQAEEALQQSQEQFRILTENAPGVIYLCDNDATFTMHYLNPAIETLTGYPPAYFLEQGHSIAELYHPDDALTISPEDEAKLKIKGSYQLAYRMRHRSGDYRWVEDFGGGVYDSDGRLRYLAGFISDITERVRAEEGFQESQRALATLISNLPGMAYRCRNDARWTDEYVSEGVYELTGYRPEELIGESGLGFASLIHPEEYEQVWDKTQQAIAERMPYRFTYRIHTRSGEEKWVWEQGRAVYDRDGRPFALEGFVADITERKQAEEVLRQAQKMESLGILAGGVAHDFNNLLAAMMGQASLAWAKLPPENPARNHVDKLVKAIRRAAGLTQQLLAYSGRGQFTLTLLDLNILIRENLHLLEASIPKNVRLQLSLSESLHPIEADPGQMQQVVMNLILNAAEAIGSAPGLLTITTGVEAISPADDIYWQITGLPLVPGPYVSLEVTDNGSGMNEETLRRIFDPFFTTKFTGRGLGLAAVLGIVRGHQGGLRVTSEAGRGTRFRLLFPAGDTSAGLPADSQVGGTAESNQPGNLILVIDDEELIREATTDILELEGLRVVTAADGEEGIAIYRQQGQEIDLVLLDLSMPGLSGYDTFRALQAINPTIRVILSSGYNQSEAMRHFEGKGVTAFVQKPYDMDRLLQEIRRNL
jgi:two-component system cell cycle sensor histidine kinase/response regulator CckA